MRRSFAADWSAAAVFTSVALVVYLLVRAILGSPDLTWVEAVSTALSAAGLVAAIAAGIGFSVLGVWFGRHMGWFKPWYAGATAGAVAVVVVLEASARLIA
jgi:hypothetical protein